MKIIITLLFTLPLLHCFGQNNLYTIDSTFIKSNKIRKAQNNWIFFDENGSPSDTMALLTFYYRPDGQKEYGIEYTLDVVETRDSIVFNYDAENREVLRRKFIEVNPRNLELDEFNLEMAEGQDSLTQWRTIYKQNTILKISPRKDTTITTLSESGKVLSKIRNAKHTTYYYDNNDQLLKEIEIPFMKVYGRTTYYEPMDTIITTFNKVGDPIQSIGNKIRVDYSYENNLLISEQKTRSEWGQNRISRTDYQYNENGKLLMETYTVNNVVRSLMKYEYNNAGILTREITLNPSTKKTELIIEYIYS